MNARPLLSDVQSQKLKPKPGDRLLVRVSVELTADQHKRIYRAITKFVGADVRILIVNCLRLKLLWKKSGEQESTELVGPKDIADNIPFGVADLDCTIVDLRPNDTLYVQSVACQTQIHKNQLCMLIREWTGNDVEIIPL